MEFISAKEFLNQPIEVQRAFKEYFDQETIMYSFNNTVNYGTFDDIVDEVPLLLEGQLRKFIEDKENAIIDSQHLDNKEQGHKGYTFTLYNKDSAYSYNSEYEDLGHDLLQAYWKVAIEIAKEQIE